MDESWYLVPNPFISPTRTTVITDAPLINKDVRNKNNMTL
jgi:hypothetical protein